MDENMAQKTEQADGVTSTGQPSPGGDNPDLDALDTLAATVDEGNGQLPDGTAIADLPAPVDYAHEAAAAVAMFATLLAGYCPEAGALWSQEKQQAVTAALVPVMQKYGVSLGALPCELILVIVAGPLLYQTARMVAAQMKREQAAARAAKNAEATDATDKRETASGIETPVQKRMPQEALYT